LSYCRLVCSCNLSDCSWRSLFVVVALGHPPFLLCRLRPPPVSTLFPYTTLFRSDLVAARPSAATTLSIGEINGALATIPIQSIMRRDIATIAPDTPIAEAARLLRDGSGPLAVLEGGDLVGLVGTADLLPELEQPEPF